MGNVVDSLASGFTKVLADVLSKPIDFLSGKACSTNCGPMWDVVCYIENFCIASLAKMAAMLFLLYLVMVFLYIVYKLGICRCVCHGLCAILCSCLSCCSSACKHGCTHICDNMSKIKRQGRRRPRRRRPRHDDIEGQLSSSSSDSDSPEDNTPVRRAHPEGSLSRRRVYLDRSLRPKNHRVTVGVSRRSSVIEGGNREEPTRHDGSERALHHHHHGIKVHHTSRFARKGTAKMIRADHRKEQEYSYSYNLAQA